MKTEPVGMWLAIVILLKSVRVVEVTYELQLFSRYTSLCSQFPLSLASVF